MYQEGNPLIRYNYESPFAQDPSLLQEYSFMPLKKKTSRVAIPIKKEITSRNQVQKKLRRFEEMNLSGKDLGGSTFYPGRPDPMFGSGLRDMSPAA